MENKPYIKVKKNNETVGMVQTPTASGTIVGIKEEGGKPKYTTDGTTYKEFGGGGLTKHTIFSGDTNEGELNEYIVSGRLYYFAYGGDGMVAASIAKDNGYGKNYFSYFGFDTDTSVSYYRIIVDHNSTHFKKLALHGNDRYKVNEIFYYE